MTLAFLLVEADANLPLCYILNAQADISNLDLDPICGGNDEGLKR